MSETQANLMTADELLKMPDDGLQHELVKGELLTMPLNGALHGILTMRIAFSLGVWVEDRNLGATFATGTGFKIASNPDTVRAPDVAFVVRERLQSGEPTEKFWPGAPDLAVEVLSPNDTLLEVQGKAVDWLKAGTRLVVVADPRKRLVTVYRSLSDIRVLTERNTLEGEDVVPGWTLPVSAIFRTA